jgi:hypothetical protein
VRDIEALLIESDEEQHTEDAKIRVGDLLSEDDSDHPPDAPDFPIDEL